MENGWYEQQRLGNRNVPKEADVYGSLVTMSGEIITTYYVLDYHPAHPQYGRWAIWKVADWVDAKPQPANYAEIERARKKEGEWE